MNKRTQAAGSASDAPEVTSKAAGKATAPARGAAKSSSGRASGKASGEAAGKAPARAAGKTAPKGTGRAAAKAGGESAAKPRAGRTAATAAAPTGTAKTPPAAPVAAPRSRRRLRRVAQAAAAGLLLVMAATAAALWWQAAPQNPDSPLRPINAVREGREPHLMLDGHDVVSYFTRGLPLLGSAQYTSQYQGVSFRFENAEHQALFDQDPARYLPQFGGFCAQGMAGAKAMRGNPLVWRLHDDKLYLFSDKASLRAFETDQPLNLAHAQGYWNAEVRGAHSLLQTARRMLLRAPRYSSTSELEAGLTGSAAARP
jgi:YHS domain-containing protein